MRNGAYARTPASLNGARFLRLLADDTRLRILALLLRTRDLCVCELVAILRLPQYQISRHLGQLRRHAILTSHREGPFVFYGISVAARADATAGPVLRAIPRLIAGRTLRDDVGRMRQLMKLERLAPDGACATNGVQAYRRRPMLRVVSRG